MIEKVHPEPREPGRSSDQVARVQPEADGEAPTWAASLTIKARHTSLEASGNASVTAAVGIFGIFGAVLTSYIASQAPPPAWPWFLGLAAAELAVAALTIIRITNAGRRRSL